METKSNFIFNYLIMLFYFAGIPLYFQKLTVYRIIYKCYLIYSFLALTSGQIFALRYLSKRNDFYVAVVFIINGFFYNATTIVLHIKKVNFCDILYLLGNELTAKSNSNIVSANNRFKKFFFTYGIGYFVVYFVSVTTPVLFFPISNKKLGDLTTLLIPSVFPWTIDTNIKYGLTVALQASWLYPLSIPVLMNLLFAVYFSIEIRVQYEILCDSLAKINRSTADKYSSTITECKLRSCVKHHQLILRFMKNFNACYNIIFTMNLLYSVSNISLILLVVATGEKTFSSILRNTAVLMASSFYLAVYCYIGQTVENVNEKFRLSIYNLKWYEKKTRNFKTSLLMVSMFNIKPLLNLRAACKYVASFELFYNIMGLSFSYYNITYQAFG